MNTTNDNNCKICKCTITRVVSNERCSLCGGQT